MWLGRKEATRFSSNCYTYLRAQVLQKQMDLELELVSDKAEKYGGHSVVLARVSVVALSSQPVDQDKRLMNDPSERLCPEYSDEEEEFSSEGEAEGSDSEPTLEMGHRRKTRAKIPPNARVCELNYIRNLFLCLCMMNVSLICMLSATRILLGWTESSAFMAKLEDVFSLLRVLFSTDVCTNSFRCCTSCTSPTNVVLRCFGEPFVNLC